MAINKRLPKRSDARIALASVYQKTPMVPGAGLEPARCCQRQILSLMRLPISPPRRFTRQYIPWGILSKRRVLSCPAMRLADFRYELPPELIAQRPLPGRAESRLLALEGPTGALRDLSFRDLPGLLRPGDLLVFNDTRVMRARLSGHKESGGQVEVLIERLTAPDEALAHVRASKSPGPGTRILLAGGERLEVRRRQGGLFRLRCADADFATLMGRHGHVPLPPYIQRPDDAADLERYQTVYALSLIHISEPTRLNSTSRMPSSA